ncbi:MAG: bifunctional hydroxymethylpyrimidine kinase/phosphomethylpyrimidine kinase [Deltaproteobacteria bacterium]|nr:bifunctional hydroxymethylpyrimidine kinase/phosphomethylpyrimidine kinase [Deltaproteobacteria bacterium]MCB9487530.1 bifunctional hydroxymethylpyrimidine kinase/phosphomethylpyrimidine kinase [Deltaproteobacteria bacterium]
MADLTRLHELIDGFARAKVAVLGDLVADVYLFAQSRRVSREAPVLVMDYVNEKCIPGGAANAVNNVKSLGAAPYAIGVVGDDSFGEILRHTLEQAAISTEHIFVDPARPTTTKQRIVGSGLHTTFQQMLRIDRGRRDEMPPAVEARIEQALVDLAERCDAVIVSDYAYGIFSDRVIERVNALAESGRAKILVDSRYRLCAFRGAYTMTPNEPEAAEAAGLEIRNENDVRRAAEVIRGRTGCETLLITRGKEGMMLFEGNGEFVAPIFGSDQIADVTGAGDTVIATFAAATAAGATPMEATVLSNVAGGLVVMKSGTATVRADEMHRAIELEDPWPAS